MEQRPRSSSRLRKIAHPVTALCLWGWLGIPAATDAQVVFEVPYPSAADLRVYVTAYESQADLFVYRAAYASEVDGNTGCWFFTDSVFRADKKIYFVKWPGQADLKIYWVPYRSRAGWRTQSRRKLLDPQVAGRAGSARHN